MIKERDITSLDHDGILTIATTSINNHLKAYDALNYLHTEGICLALNRTSYNLRNFIAHQGADPSKLFFIDAVSLSIQSPFKIQNCEYLAHAKDLAKLAATIEQVKTKLPPGDKFLIIDSFHDLAHQHNEKTLLDFMDFLGKRLRVLRMKTIIIADTYRLTKRLQKKLEELSDKTIRL